jgi:hypothetical protein
VNEVEVGDPSLVVGAEVGVRVEGCMTLNPSARENVNDLCCSSWKNLGNSLFKY